MTLRHALGRSVVLGAATGGRTFSGFGALAATAGPSVSRRGRAAVVVAALGELVADKLPKAPSRLGLPGLGGRVLAAAGCGVIASRRDDALRHRALCAAAGSAAAVSAAVLGSRWRSYADKRGTNRLLAALAEDAVVLAVAAAGSASLTSG